MHGADAGTNACNVIDKLNTYSRVLSVFEYIDSRELSRDAFVRRAIALLAREGFDYIYDYAEHIQVGAYVIGCAIIGKYNRSSRLSTYRAYHNTLYDKLTICSALKAIVTGSKDRAHFDIINWRALRDRFEMAVVDKMLSMIGDSLDVTPRAVEFIECAIAHDVARARECFPEFSEDVIELFVGPCGVEHALRETHGNFINRIGEKFARLLIARGKYLPIIAHYSRDSSVFDECIAGYEHCLDDELMAYPFDIPNPDAMLSSAAKNPDARAFDCVFTLLASRELINATCDIAWEGCEGFEALVRATRCVEARGIRATFDEILGISGDRGENRRTLPRYVDAIRAIDFILARYARDIARMTRGRRAICTGCLARSCNLFGDRMHAVIASHFDFAPDILAEIRAKPQTK